MSEPYLVLAEPKPEHNNSVEGVTYLGFKTASNNTLARIAYACEASNVLMTVGAPPLYQYGYGKPIDSQKFCLK